MTRTLTLFAFLVTLWSCVQAAEPFFEESNIWRHNKEGDGPYQVFGLVQSTKGTLLAFAEGRVGGGGDADPHHLVMKRSTDGGRTWLANQHIEKSDGSFWEKNGQPGKLEAWAQSAPVVDAKTGRIFFFYALHAQSRPPRQETKRPETHAMNACHIFSRLILTALLLAPLANLHAAELPARPNIVFIISDDQGAGDYGFMGHPQVQTPHLDRLAAQSLTFPRGFVPTSVCCPSLATIITGLYPHQHKVTANDPPLPPGTKAKGGRGSTAELTAQWNGMLDQVPTLPRLLASAGYLSFQTGKWWQGDYTRGGFTHGMSQGSRHGDAGLTIGREGMQPIYDFIAESRKQQKPFFVWYAPFMPHTPHTPPERLFTKYAARTKSPHLARYWAMCEWFDETCGELLGHLEKEKLSENTLVIYVTDNGWIQSPVTGGFAPKSKTSPFDAGHRTPILVRWPAQVKPAKSTALASSIDLVPTVLAALQLPAPEGLRGINLLDAKAVESRQQVFGEDFTIRSQTLDDVNANVVWRWVTAGRWRLILPRTFEAEGSLKTIPPDNYLKPYLIAALKAAQPMLYDLESDPKEETNLASQHPNLVAALRAKLDAHWTPKPSAK